MTDLCVVERHYSVAKRGEKEKEQHGVDTAIDTHTHTLMAGWLMGGGRRIITIPGGSRGYINV